MAGPYIRCESGGNSSQITETTLWTNTRPTSDFNAQTVSVGDISSYDYIKIKWRRGKSDATEFDTIFPNTDTSSVRHGFGGASGSDAVRYRYATFYNASTDVSFSNSLQHMQGSQSSSAIYIIPVNIIGVNV